MTYQDNFTLPGELLEQIAAEGFDALPEMIRLAYHRCGAPDFLVLRCDYSRAAAGGKTLGLPGIQAGAFVQIGGHARTVAEIQVPIPGDLSYLVRRRSGKRFSPIKITNPLEKAGLRSLRRAGRQGAFHRVTK